METQMVVCDVYELYKKGMDFVKENGLLVRSEVLLNREYVLAKNDKWKENGLWHESDEKKTKKAYGIKDTKVKEDVSELKAKYEEVFGKKPFGGWDAKKIKEKLDEKLNENK